MAIRHGCQIAFALAMWMYLAYRVASDIMGKGVSRFVPADAVAQAHETLISPYWGATVAAVHIYLLVSASLR